VRILLRPRLPVLALLLLAPSIPELLTGSTPVSRLAFDPVGFVVSYLLDVGLYGTGALLIREAAVILRKRWASILLWGAAYGIAEEGLAVHTFFQPSGSPVGALAVYGSAFGVNWLWALGLTIFHATYSIALPILLTYLWFPEVSDRRWLDRGALTLVAIVYLAEVVVFARLVGHGPSAPLLGLFLAVEAALLLAGALVPRDLLKPLAGPRRSGRWGIGFVGTWEWLAWVAVLICSGTRAVPAWIAAGIVLVVDAASLGWVVRRVGTDDPERTQFAFATGMLVPLFVWDAFVEFTVPGSWPSPRCSATCSTAWDAPWTGERGGPRRSRAVPETRTAQRTDGASKAGVLTAGWGATGDPEGPPSGRT